MSDKDPDDDKYNKDTRIPCKYGIKCYQKNPAHHKKYKHPPKKWNEEGAMHSSKKLRVESSVSETNEVITRSDLSDYDDYNIEDDDSTVSYNKEANNDDSDSDRTDNENGKNEKVVNKIRVNNDVSDSDETDVEDDKDKIIEEHGKESNDHNQHESRKNEETAASVNDKPIKSEESDKESKDNKNKYEVNRKEKQKVIGSLDPKLFIKRKFLVDMPEDFYQFWDFCKTFKPNNPSEALKDVGLILVGPFDVLSGKFDNVDKSDEEYLIHWRYYHDPPELQTVLKGDDKTGYHIGYFRDSPKELPTLLVSNSAKKDGVLHQMGGNIFSAVNMYLDELKKYGDPFKKMHIGRIQAAVKKEAETLKLSLSPRTSDMIAREKKIVTRTFNKIGLVVPYDRKTQVGYRELALDNKELASLLTKLQNAQPEQKPKYLSELEPVFTYTSIATDECDFGTGIELGWNIISHGVDSLNMTALRFLTTNYRLLNREAFAKITEAHMKNRKKGCNLSII